MCPQYHVAVLSILSAFGCIVWQYGHDHTIWLCFTTGSSYFYAYCKMNPLFRIVTKVPQDVEKILGGLIRRVHNMNRHIRHYLVELVNMLSIR